MMLVSAVWLAALVTICIAAVLHSNVPSALITFVLFVEFLLSLLFVVISWGLI